MVRGRPIQVRQGGYPRSGRKHDGLVAPHNDPVFQMVAQASGQYRPLYIAPQSHQVVLITTMIHPDHVLLDDRPFIKILRHIVAGSTNQLDAAIIGFLVGVGADKGR